MTLITIAQTLREATRDLPFGPPVAATYHPLDYAWEVHRQYLERWAGFQPAVLLVGMNPGPFGMGQTGVPFGAVKPVRDWLGLDAPIGQPRDPHPKRPVEGWSCQRDEVSGERLWGWARSFGSPEAFFRHFFVYNFCPLLFLGASGANLTPDKLAPAERQALLPPCARALRETVDALGVRWVLGVGAWAEDRAREALADAPNLHIGRILHPSPASPAANRDWAGQVETQLAAMGIALPPR